MTLHTTQLPDLLSRLRANDRAAADELFRACRARLEAMARLMLRRYPAVKAREETADVLQEASLSLLAALRTLDVADTRAFFGLAAEHVRRRLLDLARKHRRRDVPVPDDPDADIGRWEALHEAAEQLPAAPREAFGLRFYHGHTFAEMAAVLDVSESMARRWWLEAVAGLAEELRDFPEGP